MWKMFEAAVFKGKERNTLWLCENQYICSLQEERKKKERESKHPTLINDFHLVDI